jgi:hypothetical protein
MQPGLAAGLASAFQAYNEIASLEAAGKVAGGQSRFGVVIPWL